MIGSFPSLLGFVNPPENFTCHAVDLSHDINSPPKAVLAWSPPSLSTLPVQSYGVVYNREIKITNSTVYEINLEVDQLGVDFTVFVENSPPFKHGVSSSCQISSTFERRLG